MTIALISHPDCVLHQTGDHHPEQPARALVIQAACERFSFGQPIISHQAPLATRDQLIKAHGENYVDWIFSIAPKKSTIQIDPDTYLGPFTLKAALRAAGAVPFAVDLIMHHQANVAFCNIRPPGHHAEREKAMGFCFFNNVAVGVFHALDHYHLERIAIIDFDVHHGNGTQSIFQEDGRVLYCSSFEHPFYPGYEPELDNEHLLAVPLKAGTQGQAFRRAVQSAWFDKLIDFRPQFIFFSAGFDAHADDPLADLQLVDDDYVWLTTHIANIAKAQCEGRMVSVLEGGYNLETLTRCVPKHIQALI